MEEVRATGTYKEFKEILDKDFRQAAESFVHIGYMLKIARDTDILRESGYKSEAEFAKAEYGLRPDETSRFMAINDRFSEGGYSEHLQERYRQYGQTKLAEMLTLPQEIIDSLDPKMTRDEIRGIKKEIGEEKKTTDIEVLLEGQKEEQRDLDMGQQAMAEYFHTNREKFVELSELLGRFSKMPHDMEKLMDALAPSGIAAIMERVQGIGRVMISIRGLDTNIDIQNVRTLEKVTIGWEEFLEKLREIYSQMDLSDPYAAWEIYYQEPFQKKEEIAPAQKKPKQEKQPEKKEETRNEKREKPAGDSAGSGKLPERRENPGRGEPERTKSQEPGTEDKKTGTEEGQQEEQIPGQDNILNHPELLPPDMPMEAKVDGQAVPAEVELSEAQRKEECLSLISMIQGNMEILNFAAANKLTRKLLEHLEVLSR